MNILIGATASSGIMDLPLYIRVFQEKLNANIKLVISPSVKQFINPEFLKTFVDGNLYESMHRGDGEISVPHSDLSRWADVYIILPCTANTLAKAAQGMSDCLVTMLIICVTKPVIFFPNMSETMWTKPATQRNVRTLLEDGHRVVQPSGNAWITATGEAVTSGHMPPPYASAEFIRKFYNSLQAQEQEVQVQESL